jgi:amino acid transporter
MAELQMADQPQAPQQLPQTGFARFWHTLTGRAKDFRSPGVHRHLSLVAFLAWVGLGADGLSSSSYGPEEAYRTLGSYTYLAIFLALGTTVTILVVAASYTRIIEHFPTGGGGYIVATQLLGRHAGLASGCALLVDYVLTITVSIASGGDAVFSLLPDNYQQYKLFVEFSAIIALTVMNLRGVKESVTLLIPVFLIFLITHIVLIGGGILTHVSAVPEVAREVNHGLREGLSQMGFWGLALVFLRAYSMGGGTYTGIEAVSNGLGILREPKVETGKRTMVYMALSLAATAGGLLVCYMLFRVSPTPGQTLNAVLARRFAEDFTLWDMPLGNIFVILTIGVEAVLLFVAAQTGFIDGPRVMSNMALDSWLPRRFAGLSDRLTMQNGILLMGGAALLMLTYTRGSIGLLVVMYSLNVFLTFTLSQLGMTRFWIGRLRRAARRWNRDLCLHLVALALCASILVVMVCEKLLEGAWVTVVTTTALFTVCLAIRRHYSHVTKLVEAVDSQFDRLPAMLPAASQVADLDPKRPTAIILVGRYGGLGLHIYFSNLRLFPNTFHNFVFVTVGALDSEFFKDPDHVHGLEQRTRAGLERYVDIAARAGKPARYAYRLGTDVVEEASSLCVELARQYPGAVVFAGTLVFEQPSWYDRLLHNETAYAIQRRLKFGGIPMLILPLLLREASLRPEAARA